jgi:hypothetical protein
MRVRASLWPLFGLLLLAAAPLACESSGNKNGQTAEPRASVPTAQVQGDGTAAPAPTGPSGNAMAVDANPATPEVDEAASQPIGVPFEVSINITAATSDYRTYQVYLSWSPESALSFIAGSHVAEDAGYTACGRISSVKSGVQGPSGAVTACGNPQQTTNFTGAVVRMTLQCEEEAVVEIRLVDLDESPTFGTTTLGASGNIGTSTAGAGITCQS